MIQEKVIFIALLVIVDFLKPGTSEYRKLIPVCSNSCLVPSGVHSPNCFCNSKCSLIYNDCCLDAPYRTIRMNIKRPHNIHCRFVQGENKNFWMVDTCKSSWSGHSQIKEKCLETTTSRETNDIIATLPVTSPKEEVTYKNYYCGLCNDENPEDLIEWRLKALCPDKSVTPADVLQNLTFVEDKKQWGIWKFDSDGEWKFSECYLLFERPIGVTSGIRHCVSGMVSTCPSSWKNIAIRRKCKSYVDPVKWPDGPVYRNMDCAICHNKTREHFQCVYDLTTGTSSIMLSLAMRVDLSSMGQWF